MAEHNKWEHKKTIDAVDNVIIYLISMGGNNLTYLYGVFNQTIPKSTLSDRIKRLNQLNLIDSKEVKEKHVYRRYFLTDQGKTFVGSINLISNIVLVQSGVLSDS